MKNWTCITTFVCRYKFLLFLCFSYCFKTFPFINRARWYASEKTIFVSRFVKRTEQFYKVAKSWKYPCNYHICPTNSSFWHNMCLYACIINTKHTSNWWFDRQQRKMFRFKPEVSPWKKKKSYRKKLQKK